MNKLLVTVSSPEKIVWEGEAQAVTSTNSQGTFDILPEHANFVTVIENKPITIHRADEEKSFTFETAVIYVRSNVVTVYVNM